MDSARAEARLRDPRERDPAESQRCDGAKGDLDRTLQSDLSVGAGLGLLTKHVSWKSPSKHGAAYSAFTHTPQPQKVWRLTFQSPEGLPAGAVAGIPVLPCHSGPLGAGGGPGSVSEPLRVPGGRARAGSAGARAYLRPERRPANSPPAGRPPPRIVGVYCNPSRP